MNSCATIRSDILNNRVNEVFNADHDRRDDCEDDEDVIFKESFFTRSINMLSRILPEYTCLEDVIRVIDVPAENEGMVLSIAMNADLEEAIAYLGAAFVNGSVSTITTGVRNTKNKKINFRYPHLN